MVAAILGHFVVAALFCMGLLFLYAGLACAIDLRKEKDPKERNSIVAAFMIGVFGGLALLYVSYHTAATIGI